MPNFFTLENIRHVLWSYICALKSRKGVDIMAMGTLTKVGALTLVEWYGSCLWLVHSVLARNLTSKVPCVRIVKIDSFLF